MKKNKVMFTIAIVGILALIVSSAYFFWGNHGFWAEDGESFGELWHEKGHWYLELAVGGIQMVIIDLFLGLFVWKLLLKPYIAERQNRAIAEEHELHGIEDHDHELHEQMAHGFTRYDIDRLQELEKAAEVAFYHLEQRDDPDTARDVLSEVLEGR